MKKLRLFITLVISMIAFGLSAQELPQAINFQAIARDANGQALSNANIMLQLTVIDGTPEGPEVYREIRSLQTNAYGGFNFQLGREPNMANGVFADIDWANGRKFLKVDYDPTGTMSFDLSLGTIEFISVPYAFVAGEVSYIDATNASDGDVLVFNAATGHFEPQAISTGGITEETDPTVPDWAKESQKPTYDYSEILNTPEIPEVPTNVSAFANDANYITSADVPTNVSAFSNDANYITAADIPEIPEVPTNVSAFVNDANYIDNETDPTVPAWAKESEKPVYDYSEITNTPEIPEVPTNVSAFNNDANYIDNETDPTVPAWAKESEKPVYDYSEITNTPEIPEVPTNVSAFTNDAGYLTELQALSMSGDTVFLTGGSYVVLPEEMQTLSDVVAKGNMANAQLKNVTDPTEAQDAVTLSYLDAKIAELNAKIEQLQEFLNTATIEATSNPTEGGSVEGTGIYEQEQICTLIATPAKGYAFSNWTENGEVVSTDATYSFNVSNNRSLVANFYSTIPEGAINGAFSVSSTKKVYFSQGNLQYQASTNTWRFATSQLEYIGSNNANISSSYSGWIDLFGWGTGDNPTNTSKSFSDYSSYTEWGSKPISNGGNLAGQWRTLSIDEWNFLMFNRTTTSGIRYAKATVNGVVGVIILPDDWSTSYYSLSSTNNIDVAFTANTITSSNWTSMFETHGAVFLPTTGGRNGTTVYGVGLYGNYWSSSPNGSDSAYSLYFDAGNLFTYDNSRYFGRSVRLVHDAD